LYLRSEEEGKEVVTIELLEDISSRCRYATVLIILFLYFTLTCHFQLQTVWDDVRLQLRRHLLDRLSPHISEHSGPGSTSSNPSISKRIYCLQHLFFLYPESEVLANYQVKPTQNLSIKTTPQLCQRLSILAVELTVGFRSVVPLLSQALKEEIHVLSHLVDQHSILGFLSAAYLDTVARELASLMERECEAARRDNTAVTSKNRKSSVQFLEFDWRLAFKGLVPQMAHCVKVVLDDICTKSLQQEEALHSAGETSLALILTQDLTTSINSKYLTVIKELNALLPLAAACRDSSLLEVRITFVEACSTAAFAMLDRVQERASEVPSSAPLKNLPALLATVIYLHQQMQHYHIKLKDSNTAVTKVPLTLLPIQKCQDVAETIREQLTTYCIQVCSTCLLQDESHHWDDPKPFHEGERCSFSVQMWYYFLCGLRSDLWPVLPAALSKELLGNVLSETLQLLLQRYALARPSYKRHLRIRCDITAVLLYVEELMWSVCETPDALAHITPSSETNAKMNSPKWPNAIHNSCNRLLTVLITVTSPLSSLYRSVEGLKDQAASTCQLRLLISDPGNDPKMLLRILLYRDCHLPRILLKNSCESDFNQVYRRKVFVCRVCMLTLTLLGFVICFSLLDTPQSAPVVIKCLRESVIKSINDLLVHLVSMGMGWQAMADPTAELNQWDIPKCLLAIVPKEYCTNEYAKNLALFPSLIAFIIQALSLVFTSLPQVIEALPLPIWLLFHEAEKHLSQYAQSLRSAGLLIWALLGCLIQSIEEPETLEQITGLAQNQQAIESLSLLAESLKAAIGVPHKVSPDKMPNWINIQLLKAQKLCSESVFEQKESGVAGAELTEQKIGLMLLEVCHKAGGSDYLRQIYHIIQGNEVGKHSLSPAIRWLLSALVDWAWDWPRLLPTAQGMSEVTFKTLLANR
uniref:KIAA0825 n=1 Tax=Periophthalmus magnuspinnatus TaxID=409849 RepID=A0A3B4AIS6_9GOBI